MGLGAVVLVLAFALERKHVLDLGLQTDEVLQSVGEVAEHEPVDGTGIDKHGFLKGVHLALERLVLFFGHDGVHVQHGVVLLGDKLQELVVQGFVAALVGQKGHGGKMEHQSLLDLLQALVLDV